MDFEVVELPVTVDKTMRQVLLSTLWLENFCTMTVSDDSFVWTGQVTLDMITNFSKTVRMSTSEYIEHLKEALTGQDNNAFKFFLNKGVFVCIKYVKQFRVLFGKFKLRKLTGKEETLQMVKKNMFANVQYKQQVSRLTAENLHLQKELTTVVTKMTECIKHKEDMEKDLYKQFKLVLNEKKRKIVELLGGNGNADIEPTHTPNATDDTITIKDENTSENEDNSKSCDNTFVAKIKSENIDQPGPSKRYRSSPKPDQEDPSMSFNF